MQKRHRFGYWFHSRPTHPQVNPSHIAQRVHIHHMILMLTLHSSTEAAPVCENHERQLFLVEILDGLGCFVRRVGEPHLTGLLDHLQCNINVLLSVH